MQIRRKALAILPAMAVLLLLSGCGERDEQTTQDQTQQQQTQPQQADEQAGAQRQQLIPAPENVGEPGQDASVTESGLAYVILEDAGSGASPQVSDTVTVHYTGWTTDGRMFDSSVVRGEPATFPLNQLIKGWQEAIPLMNVGDKYRFWIPGELAYANSPRPDAPKGTLVFDIELIAIRQRNVQPDESEAGEESGGGVSEQI